jgi:hypothetical protein
MAIAVAVPDGKWERAPVAGIRSSDDEEEEGMENSSRKKSLWMIWWHAKL